MFGVVCEERVPTYMRSLLSVRPQRVTLFTYTVQSVLIRMSIYQHKINIRYTAFKNSFEHKIDILYTAFKNSFEHKIDIRYTAFKNNAFYSTSTYILKYIYSALKSGLGEAPRNEPSELLLLQSPRPTLHEAPGT